MANITLGQLRDLWKNVSDWVTGVATHEPKVTLSGSFATLRPMTGGSMTVASVAAEIAPGTTGRRGLWIRNEEDAIRIRIDGESITAQTGVALEPGETLILAFDPAVFVPVFAISEAGLALIDYNWW